MKTISVVLLAGIVFTIVQPVPAARAAKFTEKIVYAFAGGEDGANPIASLIDVKGTLYGTTAAGGKSFHGHGSGTVFSINLSTGAETAIYTFGRRDSDPQASLIDVKGKLYGTTAYGGGSDCGSTPGCGTAFSISRNTGAEKLLYSFCNQTCASGAYPLSSLLDVNGVLYGTTELYGANCPETRLGSCGTVFSLDPKTGAETVLYSFCSEQNCTDGALPLASLIDVNGILYGTTASGGANNDGIVFSLDPGTGVETVLHSFTEGTDGGGPAAGLLDVSGVLYGTTVYGGASNGGTVFSLDTSTGVETVLYSFCSQRNCMDGDVPMAGLIDVKGTLYGTAWLGGAGTSCYDGCGAVFSIDPNTGTERVVHSFTGGKDGAQPVVGLIDVDGTFYGTTELGGGTRCRDGQGCGTVFALTKQ